MDDQSTTDEGRRQSVPSGRYWQALHNDLATKGWRGLIPLAPGEKRPNLRNWQALTRGLPIDNPDVADCLGRARRQLRVRQPLNLGQVTGCGVAWVDVDSGDPAVAEIVRGFRPTIVKVGSRGIGAAFRDAKVAGLVDPFLPGVAIYGGGPNGRPGLTALHGIHPKTGRDYSYEGTTPLDAGPADLTKLPDLETLRAELLKVPSVAAALEERRRTTYGSLASYNRPSLIAKLALDESLHLDGVLFKTNMTEVLVSLVRTACEGDRFQSFLDALWAAHRIGADCGMFDSEGWEEPSEWLETTITALEKANDEAHGGDMSFCRGQKPRAFYDRHTALARRKVHEDWLDRQGVGDE